MKLIFGFLALSGVDANARCDITESETCPCSQVYWKKAKIGSKSASAIQKIGRSHVELKVAVQNHILDKEAQFYPQAYQGEIRI